MPTPPDFTNGTPLDASSLNAAGLWLVKSDTVPTGVSSYVVTGAFSTDYDNYLITVSGGSATTNSTINFRCGTQASGYRLNYLYASYTSAPQAFGSVSENAIFYTGFQNTTGLNALIHVSNPFLAAPTLITADGGSIGNFTGRVQGMEPGNTSFTSFTLLSGSGTMTGARIRVYGYRK
jgi:hypothetical protein